MELDCRAWKVKLWIIYTKATTVAPVGTQVTRVWNPIKLWRLCCCNICTSAVPHVPIIQGEYAAGKLKKTKRPLRRELWLMRRKGDSFREITARKLIRWMNERTVNPLIIQMELFLCHFPVAKKISKLWMALDSHLASRWEFLRWQPLTPPLFLILSAAASFVFVFIITTDGIPFYLIPSISVSSSHSRQFLYFPKCSLAQYVLA